MMSILLQFKMLIMMMSMIMIMISFYCNHTNRLVILLIFYSLLICTLWHIEVVRVLVLIFQFVLFFFIKDIFFKLKSLIQYLYYSYEYFMLSFYFLFFYAICQRLIYIYRQMFHFISALAKYIYSVAYKFYCIRFYRISCLIK